MADFNVQPRVYPVRGTILFLVVLTVLCAATAALAHSWKSPESAAALENPLPVSEENVTRGRNLYQDFCAACHGADARGGERALQEGGMVPPDLVRRLGTHSQGDFFWKITHGRGDMPGFGEDLSPEEIWTILRYLESRAS